jgi:hypothetical protein
VSLASSDASEADDDHLLQLTGLLGPLPEELYEKWTRSSLYFDADRKRIDSGEGCHDKLDSGEGDDDELDSDEGDDDELDSNEGDEDELGSDEGCDGELDSSPGPPDVPKSLEEAFERNKPSDLGGEDARETVALVHGILQYESAKRPSIESLLRHSWFSNK